MCLLSVGFNHSIIFFFREKQHHLLYPVLSVCGYVNHFVIDSSMEYFIEYGYIGLFIASFLAATILPFSSEVVLTGVLLAGSAYWPCMIAATLGNFLGGMTCYWLGMVGKVEWIKKYLRMNIDKLLKMQDWLKNKGSWISFFVFLPGIGDFIAVGLGFLRANVWMVAFYMFLGKALRYWIWMEFVYKAQSILNL
jgi:membrane protein YqaA with SNARE-associated domain